MGGGEGGRGGRRGFNVRDAMGSALKISGTDTRAHTRRRDSELIVSVAGLCHGVLLYVGCGLFFFLPFDGVCLFNDVVGVGRDLTSPF